MTDGNKRKSSVPVFLHRPGSRLLASGRTRQNVHNSGSSETVPCVRPPPTTRTPPAHKPPASMSWNARRTPAGAI